MRGVGHLNIPELLVMIIQSIKEDPFERLVKVSEPITYSVINRYFFQNTKQKISYKKQEGYYYVP